MKQHNLFFLLTEISDIRHSCKYVLLRHLTGSDPLTYAHTPPLLTLLGYQGRRLYIGCNPWYLSHRYPMLWMNQGKIPISK